MGLTVNNLATDKQVAWLIEWADMDDDEAKKLTSTEAFEIIKSTARHLEEVYQDYKAYIWDCGAR